MQQFDCVIVGGGIHGTYLAQRLLEETPIERSGLLVCDPADRLLAAFRRKARRCGMDALRSSFVHHLDTEPFSLERFADRHQRTDELVSTVDYPLRPSLDLFLDHADWVIEENDLSALHHQARVETITDRTGGLTLETTDGTLAADHAVLAIGAGRRVRRPDWTSTLPSAAPVTHVWDEYDPAADVERTIVVGGGITAVRLATTLSETESVTLLTRHPLEWKVAEASPPWINWSRIEPELHELPPGSKERWDVITEARNDGTVPPYLYSVLEDRLETGALNILQGEVETARDEDDSVLLTVDHGTTLRADRVVLATGSQPPFDHPFVDRVTAALSLERGYNGMPVLSDETLAWRKVSGERSPLFVSGALALGSVGPYAPNIPGARRAADRITAALADPSRQSVADAPIGSD